MKAKNIIRKINKPSASVSVSDTLASICNAMLDKYSERIIIQYPYAGHQNYTDRIIPIIDFLYKYDKSIYKNFSIFTMQFENYRRTNKDKLSDEGYKRLMYQPTEGKRLIRIGKKDFILLEFFAYNKKPNDNGIDGGNISIRIIGPNKKKVKRKLEKISLENGGLTTYAVDNSGTWNQIERNLTRNFDMIYSHQKYQILRAIENHEKNREIYKKFGKKHKFSIMMYGEPGTGKSSLIEAIANHLHRDLVIFGPETPIGTLVDSITSGTYAINVLEEVDLYFESEMASSNEREKSTNGVVNKSGKISTLMQILDGLYSSDSLFFIMTTNHIEKIDDRLLRNGRVDLKIELTGLKKEMAMKYCTDHGLGEEQASEILPLTLKNGLYNQSAMEYYVLNEITKID